MTSFFETTRIGPPAPRDALEARKIRGHHDLVRSRERIGTPVRCGSRVRLTPRLARVAALVLVAASCRQAVPTYSSADPGPSETSVLTPDGTDSYRFTASTGALEAHALDSNTQSNLRTVFWPAGSPSVVDAQSCATWTGPDGAASQQGAALRISVDASGHTKAVTVTKNIFYGATWIFKVHTWDTARAVPLDAVASIDLEPLLAPAGVPLPLPWHFCARAIGSTVELKVWVDGETEPKWGDQTHGRSAELPPGWDIPGATGWFIGHVPPAGTANFVDLRTWKYVLVDPTAPPPADETIGTSPDGSNRVGVTRVAP